MSKKLKTAFITGAANGLGRAFAFELASLGYHLLLTDKDIDNLEKTSIDIKGKFDIELTSYPADLSSDNDIAMMSKVIHSYENIEVVINDAGFGTKGAFAETDIEKSIAMLKVHVEASTRFAHAALRHMIARRKGYIINVASGAAFMYTANWTMYNATKLYLVSFSESLSRELKGTGVKVQALCPGMTRTRFHHSDELTFDTTKVADIFWQNPEVVAKKAIRALQKNKVLFIPGLLNKLIWGRGIFSAITSYTSTQMNK